MQKRRRRHHPRRCKLVRSEQPKLGRGGGSAPGPWRALAGRPCAGGQQVSQVESHIRMGRSLKHGRVGEESGQAGGGRRPARWAAGPARTSLAKPSFRTQSSGRGRSAATGRGKRAARGAPCSTTVGLARGWYPAGEAPAATAARRRQRPGALGLHQSSHMSMDRSKGDGQMSIVMLMSVVAVFGWGPSPKCQRSGARGHSTEQMSACTPLKGTCAAGCANMRMGRLLGWFGKGRERVRLARHWGEARSAEGTPARANNSLCAPLASVRASHSKRKVRTAAAGAPV